MHYIHQADVDGETLQQALGDTREPGAGTYLARGYRQGYDENVARQLELRGPSSQLGPSSEPFALRTSGGQQRAPGAPLGAAQRSHTGGGASSSSHSWQDPRPTWVPKLEPPPPPPLPEEAAGGTFVPDWGQDVEEID